MKQLFTSPQEVTLSQSEKVYKETLESNEMNPLLAVYSSLINLGTSASDTRDAKYIRAFNFISFVTFIVTLFYLVAAIFLEKWVWIVQLALVESLCIGTLTLNSYGKVNLSRYVYLMGINLLVFFSALFIGPIANVEHHLILAVALPFLVFDYRRVYEIGISVVLSVALLAFYYSGVIFFEQYHFSEDVQQEIARIVIFSQLLVLLAMVIQFARTANQSELELETSKAHMMLQTTELRRSNNDLEQFAYIISHDLKAPVRNISSFLNLLQVKHAATLNDEAKEFVKYSHSGAKRLERLIDDVLAYCRIGTNLPTPVPVNLNDVVNTIQFELRERVNSVNGSIVINKELPVVHHVHASLMYHVFQNLISNGLKFNKSEAPRIDVSWTNSLNHYTFSVHDNGIGISKEYSTTIFQMFKRLHTEQEFDGTGIGLAICKKITEYYHGDIWFDSSAEKGTTFYFTIRKF
jgi:signal transduction histidine kinase